MPELTTDNVYGAIERRLRDFKFNVKHLYRDSRGDWGDDGGYLVSISKKNDKIYLHIFDVNYNSNVDIHILEESDERLITDKEAYQDYMTCDSIQSAQDIINNIILDLNTLIDLDYDSIESDNLIPQQGMPKITIHNTNQYYMNILNTMLFSFSEYQEQQTKSLNELSNTVYVPDYSDPEEYIDEE